MHINFPPLQALRPTPFLVVLFTLFALVFTRTEAQAGSCSAADIVISAGQAYDRAARSGSASAFSSAVSRYSDIRSIAMFSLGRYRKQLPPSDESQYVQLTRTFMGRFMLERSKGLRVGTLTIVDCSGSSSNTLVRARTSTGDTINFKVFRSGSGYLIRDINVGGVWLVQRMRSTFVGTLQRTGGNFRELYKFLKSY